MTTRAERRALADQKREEYLRQIVDFMRAKLDIVYEQSKDSRMAFKHALYSGDLRLTELLEQHPRDAHLIRSAGYQLRARLEKALGLKV